MKHTKKTSKPDKNKTSYLGPYSPDHANDKPPHQNVLAPFGLDEQGHPTDAPLPGPVVLSHDKDTSAIPGPPYLGPNQHHKFGFKPTKDEGIHGPPPFVVKPTKEDLDKKRIQKPKNNKTGFKPTLPPPEEDNEDYDDANDEDQFHDIPHFHAHPNPHPGRPQVIYVNHPGDLPHLGPSRKPLPNEVVRGHFPPNVLDLAHSGPGGPVHVYNLPPNPQKQDKRPHPTQAEIEGDEEAALHYHTHDLPDDPRIIAKEILAHLHNAENGIHDQVFGGQHETNNSEVNFSIHHAPLNQTGWFDQRSKVCFEAQKNQQTSLEFFLFFLFYFFFFISSFFNFPCAGGQLTYFYFKYDSVLTVFQNHVSTSFGPLKYCVSKGFAKN